MSLRFNHNHNLGEVGHYGPVGQARRAGRPSASGNGGDAWRLAGNREQTLLEIEGVEMKALESPDGTPVGNERMLTRELKV